MSAYKTSIGETVDAMEIYGGGFIKKLATLYRAADDDNRRRLEQAFPDFFEKYDDIALARRKA